MVDRSERSLPPVLLASLRRAEAETRTGSQMPQRTMPVRFLRAAASTAARRDVALEDWLQSLGIEPTLLIADRSRITVEQATRLIRELWRLTDDELAGLGPKPVPRGTFRLLGLAVLGAGDLGTVLERFEEFSHVIPGLPQIRMETDEASTRVTLGMEHDQDPEHFTTDLVLSVGLRFCGWLAACRLPLELVELPYATPESAEDYDLVFGGRICFDQPQSALVFSNDMLTLPVMQDEASLDEWLRNAPADLLMFRDYGTTVADQVRRILERGLRGEWPTADYVAAQLAMSTQHMRRVLREEGTSFSIIKEEVLRDAAITSLVRGQETVADLSARLGFSESSAFHRAFRRWTGSAPGAYRPKHSPE